MAPSEEEVLRVAQALSRREWVALCWATYNYGYVARWDDPLIERGLLLLDNGFQRVYITAMGVRVLKWRPLFDLEI